MKKTRLETGIYRREDGKIWVRATAKDPYTGQMVYKTKTMKKGTTRRQARQMREHLRGLIVSTRRHEAPDVRTVEDYSVWWLEQKAERLKPSTLRDYAGALANLCDVIGGLPIRAVVRADLQRVVTEWESRLQDVPPNRWLKATGKSTTSEARRRVLEYLDDDEATIRDLVGDAVTTRRTLKRMLRAGQLTERVEELPPEPYATSTLKGWWRRVSIMLRDAHADGLLEADPTVRVQPPETSRRSVRERQTLSARELGEFVAAVREVAPQRYAEVAMLAYTGMRPGEMYALTWDDIDWAGNRIHVREAVSRREIVDSTKTGDPREAPMVQLVASALKEHHARLLKAEKLEELVFPASRQRRKGQAKKPRAADSLRKAFDAAAAKADVSITVRALVLRRTFDTLMVTSGVDRIVLRSMIGHTSEEMTERYAGVRIEDKHAAVLRLVQTEEE